ncbi:MAG: hypothetical protein IJP37_01900, partial [Clostridia bacterium]|nr:hypothetical protein [Clostridia bacterium]
MKRMLSLLIAMLMALALFAGCAAPVADAPAETAAPAEDGAPLAPPESEEEPEATEPFVSDEPFETKVMALKGPTGIGLAYMMDQEAVAADGFRFEIAGAPDDVVAAIVSGSTDIAAVPVNL